jgi:hypothetical protein
MLTARAFRARRREPVDNDQELLALGLQICPPPFFMAFRSAAETGHDRLGQELGHPADPELRKTRIRRHTTTGFERPALDV